MDGQFSLGYNVAGLLAGLGICACSTLAAKDTAANLFGSIALLLDNLLELGMDQDRWIEGVVENIGMKNYEDLEHSKVSNDTSKSGNCTYTYRELF